MVATTGVLEYLREHLPRASLLQLLKDESRGRFVCRAILQRSLSPAAQQVVVRLSVGGGTFAKANMAVWIKQGNKTIFSVLQELYAWGIIEEASADNIQLTEHFRQAFSMSLCRLDHASVWEPLNDAQMRILEEQEETAHETITSEDLERFTHQQWDTVLHFLVGSTGKADPPPAMIKFLLQTGLMQSDPEYRGGDGDNIPLVITQKGYDFMLQDHGQQIWHFCQQYLQSLESHEKAAKLIPEALLLMIGLSFCRVGDVFLTSCLSKRAQVMIKDLAHFGLLYLRPLGKNLSVFYPTRVAMQLVADNSASAARWSLSSKALEECLAHPQPQDSAHLAVIVQTNFQLCAYTTSELHVSMLGLFCDVQTIRRLPNIVFMTITRDSVKGAFSLGIQARQILRFLEKHAHPRLRTGTVNQGEGPIPANVVDQIWLWDRERNRVTFVEVYEHQCLMEGEYDAVHTYAKDNHALRWSSRSKQKLLIEYERGERVQAYVRQWRAQQAHRR